MRFFGCCLFVAGVALGLASLFCFFEKPVNHCQGSIVGVGALFVFIVGWCMVTVGKTRSHTGRRRSWLS